MKPFSLLKNLANLFRYDILSELNDCQRQLQEQTERILCPELWPCVNHSFCEVLKYIRFIGPKTIHSLSIEADDHGNRLYEAVPVWPCILDSGFSLPTRGSIPRTNEGVV